MHNIHSLRVMLLSHNAWSFLCLDTWPPAARDSVVGACTADGIACAIESAAARDCCVGTFTADGVAGAKGIESD